MCIRKRSPFSMTVRQRTSKATASRCCGNVLKMTKMPTSSMRLDRRRRYPDRIVEQMDRTNRVNAGFSEYYFSSPAWRFLFPQLVLGLVFGFPTNHIFIRSAHDGRTPGSGHRLYAVDEDTHDIENRRIRNASSRELDDEAPVKYAQGCLYHLQ